MSKSIVLIEFSKSTIPAQHQQHFNDGNFVADGFRSFTLPGARKMSARKNNHPKKFINGCGEMKRLEKCLMEKFMIVEIV